MTLLQTMSGSGMFKELVFYLEACESGSMFAALPDDIRVYATAASNAHESSWGTYCMPEDVVDGQHVGACLGDLYSVSWMEVRALGMAPSSHHDHCQPPPSLLLPLYYSYGGLGDH